MRSQLLFATIAVATSLVLASACRAQDEPTSQPSAQEGQPLAEPPAPGQAVATFAGGCFWCMEGPFEAIDGVVDAISGYTGGSEQHPTYYQVGHGNTGHAEAVRVVYDPSRVTYEQLLDVYWRQVDPTDAGGQFVDRGRQYRPAIFVHDEAQRQAAEASKQAIAASGVFDEPIIVPIEDAGDFWVAEDYHQNFYRTNPEHYQRYRSGSGRVQFIREHWGESAAH